MRTMFDTTDIPAASIPPDAQLVAGYIDGHYQSYYDMVRRFPHAIVVPIAVFASTDNGWVLDCEAGDATPAQAPGWVKKRRAAGIARPTVYTPTSQAGAVQSACTGAGLIQGRDWELWVAQYDGRPTPTGHGEVAKQYIDHGPNGENYDMSAVFDDDWPHVTTGGGASKMDYVIGAAGRDGLLLLTGGSVFALTDPESANQFLLNGAKRFDVSASEWDQFKAVVK